MNNITNKKDFLSAFSKAWEIYNELYPSLGDIKYINFNRMNFYVARSINWNSSIPTVNFYCVCDCGYNQSHNLVQGVFTFKSRENCETFIEKMGDDIMFLFTNIYNNGKIENI